jgi:hypothetical protein
VGAAVLDEDALDARDDGALFAVADLVVDVAGAGGEGGAVVGA